MHISSRIIYNFELSHLVAKKKEMLKRTQLCCTHFRQYPQNPNRPTTHTRRFQPQKSCTNNHLYTKISTLLQPRKQRHNTKGQTDSRRGIAKRGEEIISSYNQQTCCLCFELAKFANCNSAQTQNLASIATALNCLHSFHKEKNSLEARSI